MSAWNMTARRVFLDPQPGGVPPSLHLKPGTTGIQLLIYIRTQAGEGTGFTTSNGRRAVLKGVRPDGHEVYLSLSVSYLNGGRDAYVIVSSAGHLAELTAVAGRYVLELAIYNTTATVTRRNEGNYDRLTAAKFYIDVDRRA